MIKLKKSLSIAAITTAFVVIPSLIESDQLSWLGIKPVFAEKVNASIDDIIEAAKAAKVGEKFFKEGKYEDAIKCYNKAIKCAPYAKYYSGRGRCFDMLKKYEKALEDFSQAIRLVPNEAYYYYARGVIFLNMDKFDEAQSDCDKALSFNSNHEGAKELQRLIMNNRKAYVPGGVITPCPTVTTCNGNYQSVVDFYDKHIAEKPDLDSLAYDYRCRGEAKFALGQYEQAINDFNATIAICQNNDLSNGLHEDEIVWAYYNLGKLYFHLGQFRQAINNYEQAIFYGQKYNAAPLGCYFAYGMGYLQIGDYAAAQRNFSKDDSWGGYLNSGLILLQQYNNFDGAFSEFCKGIERNNEISELYYGRGFIYERRGQYSKAIADYSKAIKLNPSEIKYYKARAYSYYANQKFTEAIGDCKVILQYEPNCQDAINMMNGARVSRQQLRESRLATIKNIWAQVYDNVSEYEHSEDWDFVNEIITTVLGENENDKQEKR